MGLEYLCLFVHHPRLTNKELLSTFLNGIRKNMKVCELPPFKKEEQLLRKIRVLIPLCEVDDRQDFLLKQSHGGCLCQFFLERLGGLIVGNSTWSRIFLNQCQKFESRFLL